ncbi:MAG: hypothetical protein Q4C95_00280 [Planctomycetia bacterium]|nr:hypothetical protein [Planctomycetia bacterium]
MISKTVIQEIERLLALGTFSQKQIAILTSVSRGSVNAIATGKRQRLLENSSKYNDQYDSIDLPNFRFPEGPIARCPSCGAYVKTPCLACQLNELQLK